MIIIINLLNCIKLTTKNRITRIKKYYANISNSKCCNRCSRHPSISRIFR